MGVAKKASRRAVRWGSDAYLPVRPLGTKAQLKKKKNKIREKWEKQ